MLAWVSYTTPALLASTMKGSTGPPSAEPPSTDGRHLNPLNPQRSHPGGGLQRPRGLQTIDAVLLTLENQTNLTSHGDLSRPQQGPQGRIKADRLWQELGGLLNSLGGGVLKPVEKWKKVWADWKTKTKKKAMVIRCMASGTGGGPSSRQTLTAAEERVLNIMGLTAVVGLTGIEERGFDAPPLLQPPTRDSAPTVCASPATDEIMLDFIPSPFLQATPASTTHAPPTSSGELPCQLPPPVLTTGSASAPMPSATSPTMSTSRGPLNQRRHRASPSPTPSTPRRRQLLRARTRRTQTPFERATSEFVAVENRRLQLEADREKNLHEREMEKMRLESRRIDNEANLNQILNRLADSIDNLIDILPQLRPSSLPSTDIIP